MSRTFSILEKGLLSFPWSVSFSLFLCMYLFIYLNSCISLVFIPSKEKYRGINRTASYILETESPASSSIPSKPKLSSQWLPLSQHWHMGALWLTRNIWHFLVEITCTRKSCFMFPDQIRITGAKVKMYKASKHMSWTHFTTNVKTSKKLWRM